MWRFLARYETQLRLWRLLMGLEILTEVNVEITVRLDILTAKSVEITVRVEVLTAVNLETAVR